MDDRDDRRSETEPRPTTPDEERRGSKPVREYPDEGVRSHDPTDPATGKTPTSSQADGAAEDDPSAG